MKELQVREIEGVRVIEREGGGKGKQKFLEGEGRKGDVFVNSFIGTKYSRLLKTEQRHHKIVKRCFKFYKVPVDGEKQLIVFSVNPCG